MKALELAYPETRRASRTKIGTSNKIPDMNETLSETAFANFGRKEREDEEEKEAKDEERERN